MHLNRLRDTLISPIILSNIWQSAAFPYIKEAQKAAKLLNKIYFSNWHSSRYQWTLFIQLIYCIFHVTMYQPIVYLHLSVYKPHIHVTHNSLIRSDEGLKRQLRNLFTVANFTLSTQLIKPNYLACKVR